MKKRLEKKIEKMRRKKVHEILEMALEINGTHSRAREETGDRPTAFFEFSGHIAQVNVRVHNNGWESGRAADSWLEAYIGRDIGGIGLTGLKEELENVMEGLRHAGKM